MRRPWQPTHRREGEANSQLAFSQSASTLTGRSSSTVRRLVRIANVLTPETRKLIRETDWADNQRTLVKLCKLPPEMQEEVASKMATGESNDWWPSPACYLSRVRITASSWRFPQRWHEVPSGSVDLILTDAPYEREYLELFQPLSHFANRVLREGGSLNLIYAARTRNGFTPASRVDLFKKLGPLEIDDCPFANLPERKAGRWGAGLTAEKMKDCRWLKPKLVGQFEFVEWTDVNHLRHTKFIALRDDKKAKDVVREA
jgi:ATP dependent DNA ligase C terminal region